MNGRPLAPVTGGLVEGATPGEQPIGTYAYGRNVRGVDPRTGKIVWAAQRAGLTRCGPYLAEDTYARRFFSASRIVRARQLVSLNTTPQENVEPAEVQIAWESDLDDFSVDVATGIDGQGHYLLRSGDVAIVNKKGREVDRIPSATPNGFEQVPRVYAGADGAVYTAYTRDLPFEDEDTGESGAGRIVRWVKQEDGLWERAWTAVIPERISTFAFRLQYLWWAEDPRREDPERGFLPAAIGNLANPLLSGDIGTRTNVAPRPVFDIQITDNGSALVSAPENLERTFGSSVAYTDRSVAFTPPEILSWSETAWSWLEKDSLEDGGLPSDGVEIDRLRDKRKDPSNFTPISEDEPSRIMQSRDAGGFFTKPRYQQSAFGGFGGIAFDDASVMYSGPNADIADPSQQLAIIPGSPDDFSYYTVVEFTEDQAADTATIRQIASQRSLIAGQPSWRLVAQGLDVSLVDLNNGVVVGPITVQSVSRAAVIAVEHPGVGQNIRLSVNGQLATAGVASPAVQQGGEQSFAAYPNVTDRGPRFTRGRGFYNEINLFRAATTRSSNSGNFERALDNDLATASGGPEGFWELLLRFPDPGPPFEAISITANTDRARLRLRLFGLVGDNTSLYTQVVELPVESDGFTRYEVRLREEWDVDAYDRVLFILDNGVTDGGQINVFDVSARDYSSNNVPAALHNWGEDISLGVLGFGEHQILEGYLAHKYGIAHELRNTAGDLLPRDDGGHPFNGAGDPPGGTGNTQVQGEVIAAINGPDPMVVKYAPDGTPVAAARGAGVGLGAGVNERQFWTIGDPNNAFDALTRGTLITRFRDRGRRFDREAGILAGTDDPFQEPTPIKVGPASSLFLTYRARPIGPPRREVRRYDGQAMSLDWTLQAFPRVLSVDVAGNQLDEREIGGDAGPEFLYAARDDISLTAARIDVLGLRDNGEPDGRRVDKLAVLANGDVVRLDGDEWTVIDPGALPGSIIGTATLGGRTIIADGIGYRVYDHNLRQIRDFEEAVSGEFPPRCKLIATYRARLVVARGDEQLTFYKSAIGDPFDFNFGPEVASIGRAIAGTTAVNGRSPEPITALIPYRDDFLFIGTEESLFLLNGDLADGGRLDQIDKSQGVAFGYAWCESPNGIYYFSSRGGVFFISPQGGLRLMTEGSVQRRMEEIDLSKVRVELCYNWIEKAVHVYVIPHALGSDVEHFVMEERTGAWHIDTFGSGFARAITTASTLYGDTAEDRSVILGTGDGRALVWDQYAVDDDGQPVGSEVTIGPIAPESDGLEVNMRGVYPLLASDQAGIEVGVRASNVPDAPGQAGDFKPMAPGRQLGVPFNVTAPSVFLTFRGLGRAWTAHAMRADVTARGMARRI